MSMQNEPQPHQENQPEQAGVGFDKDAATVQPDLHAGDDGRNREWEDRARVNLETVPEGTHTNIERDFEPEREDSEGKRKNPKDDTVY